MWPLRSWFQRFGRNRPDFDPALARELLLLTGRAYAFYFEQTVGNDPADWPAQARQKYERYAAPDLVAGMRLERRITWSPMTSRSDGARSYTIGFVARKRRRQFLIFRGTAAEREWWKDFQLLQKPCPVPAGEANPGQAHLGFLKIYASLDPPIAELARDLKGGLYIGGHSLGGALATLAALELHHLRPQLYTFASPRVGDPTFAANFARLVPAAFRVVNFWDPIPRQPDENVDFVFKQYAYRHVGREQLLYSLSQTGGESIPQLVATGMDLATYVLEGGRFDPLFTHQLKCYEHGLRKLVPDSPGK